jgi:hypothetical protein
MRAVWDQSRPPSKEQAEEQSAHEGDCAGPRNSPRFTYREMAEGARFENSEALETIGTDLTSSHRSQSLTEESEVGEKPVKADRTR